MSAASRPGHRFSFCASQFPADAGHRGLTDAVAQAMQRPFRLQPLAPAAPFTYRMDGVMLGLTMVARLHTSPIDVHIGPSAAPEDNLVVEVLAEGQRWLASQGGVQLAVGAGEALISMGGLPRHNRVETDAQVLILQLPRRSFSALIDDTPGRPLRRLPADTPGLATVRHYLQSVLEAPAAADTLLARLMAEQLRDLCLALMRTAWPGITRLQGPLAWSIAARQLVAQRLGQAGFDEEAAASELGISGSYLRRLFSTDGGFAAYVRRERLDRARLLLLDPGCASMRVIDIAQACGFGDLSTFNRRFRQRFGQVPSQLRDEQRPPRRTKRPPPSPAG
ncbi:AraC family transcriptional regulator [Piscinibacter sakaiensis]|uniref:Transcriptional regulator, AraC family n=1 Tax=Piscinibacter sakaiensis TaxID=1547922 RepID=A0A0K8P0B2_PISS1|nr:AraC family transcriptional regulator [Piscinibacter sakaiensis]GAP35979.1 transcriptional regulator, AraC family [Piscinibacter sakaiensis]